MADGIVEVKEEQLEEIVTDLKAIRKDAEKESKETQAERDKQEKAWTAYDEKWDELTKTREEETKKTVELEERIAKMGAKMTKISSTGEEIDPQKVMLHKGFIEFARTGTHPTMQGEEMKEAYAAEYKTLTVGNNAEGGVFVDPEFTTEIQKNIREFSPVRQIARISTVRSGELRVPARTQFTTAEWTSEIGTRPSNQEPRYKGLIINTHEQSVKIGISRQTLDEAEINFEQEIRMEGAEGLAANEADGFTNGDGNGKPSGFLVASDPGDRHHRGPRRHRLRGPLRRLQCRGGRTHQAHPAQGVRDPASGRRVLLRGDPHHVSDGMVRSDGRGPVLPGRGARLGPPPG